jgi:hypothetical protein
VKTDHQTGQRVFTSEDLIGVGYNLTVIPIMGQKTSASKKNGQDAFSFPDQSRMFAKVEKGLNLMW